MSKLGGRLVVLFAICGATTYCYVGPLWNGLYQSDKLGEWLYGNSSADVMEAEEGAHMYR